MWDYELGSQSRSAYGQYLMLITTHVVRPHLVAFLGSEDFKNLFCLSFSGISHLCAGVWVSSAGLCLDVVDVEDGQIG